MLIQSTWLIHQHLIWFTYFNNRVFFSTHFIHINHLLLENRHHESSLVLVTHKKVIFHPFWRPCSTRPCHLLTCFFFVFVFSTLLNIQHFLKSARFCCCQFNLNFSSFGLATLNSVRIIEFNFFFFSCLVLVIFPLFGSYFVSFFKPSENDNVKNLKWFEQKCHEKKCSDVIVSCWM